MAVIISISFTGGFPLSSAAIPVQQAPTSSGIELGRGEGDTQAIQSAEDLNPSEPGFDDNVVSNETGANWQPTINPNKGIIPGKMRSDTEVVPGGFTKEQADQAELQEAQELSEQRLTPYARTASSPCRTYWPSPYRVCGAIREKYDSLGGPRSFLTWPKSNELGVPDGVGRRTEFLNGFIYWHPSTGAHSVTTHFSIAWARTGWERGPLGYPTSDEFGLDDKLGRKQSFEHGSIYGSLAGLATIHGAIYEKWRQAGEENGPLGYPIGDETPTRDGIGRFSGFTSGLIYWHPEHGAQEVSGDILFQWGYADFEEGFWGYPIGEPVQQEDGWFRQEFVNGPLYGLVAYGIADLYDPNGGDGVFGDFLEDSFGTRERSPNNSRQLSVGNNYTNKLIFETQDACGNTIVLRRGFWNGSSGFGWDKIYHKHNVRSIYSLKYFIEHSCQIRREGNRLIYENDLYRLYCDLLRCRSTGEWFRPRLVYSETGIENSEYPLGVLTFYPLTGEGNPPLVGEKVPDWFSTELPKFIL